MPAPNEPDPRPGLESGSGSLDRAVREDLDRFLLESSVARQDSSAELVRDLQASAPLDLGELTGAMDRLEGAAVPSFSELENLLESSEGNGLQLEKNLLADLLREGAEGQTILKRGLAFVKHRRYAQAVEWWVLNRQGLDAATSKLHLLLLIMETLTYHWANDATRAASAQQKVFAHPLYRGAVSRGPEGGPAGPRA
jgi:hypothetical protein